MLKKIIFWLILVIIVVFLVKALLNHFDKKDTPSTTQLLTPATLAANINPTTSQLEQPKPVDQQILKNNETKILSASTANESTS